MNTDTDIIITRDHERIARLAIADPPYLGRAALYFGGKRRAAPLVWRALGDPAGYVTAHQEDLFGGAA